MAVTVAASAIEGLFIRSLKPTGRFREALRERGLDLDHPAHEYPLSVWTDCVDLAAAEVYPRLSLADAWVQMGRHFIEGYFQTITGRMISTMLPFLSAKAFVNQVPRFMKTGKRGIESSVRWVDAKHAVVEIPGTHCRVGALMKGVLEVSFERMSLPGVSLEAKETGGIDAELHVGLP